jgi:hypothetical protein
MGKVRSVLLSGRYILRRVFIPSASEEEVGVMGVGDLWSPVLATFEISVSFRLLGTGEN